MKIMITGPQGSGKTTQAKILSQKYHLFYLGIGDLMRELSQEKSSRGELVKKALEEGKLCPDEIVAEAVGEKLADPKAQKGFITDGYPRNPAQLKLIKIAFDYVFYLDLPKDLAIKRLLARGRPDDSQDQIEQRLDWYYSQTEAILDYYRQVGVLITINGDQTIEEITQEIEKALKKQSR